MKDSDESPMNEEITEYSQMNGNHIGENDSSKHGVNSSLKVNGDFSKTVNGESYGNGEALINEVDHINLSGEEEEKRYDL